MEKRGQPTHGWLLETTLTVQQCVTMASGRSELGEALVEALVEQDCHQFAWIGRVLPSGRTKILSHSGSLPELVDFAGESVTVRTAGSGQVEFHADSQSNEEYTLLREEHEIPSAESTISVPFTDREPAVLHLYTDADLSADRARDSFEATGKLLTESLKRLQYKAELERETERLERIRSVVSHDFGNPLNLAAGRLDLVRMECDSDHIGHVEKGLEEINALTDDVSTFVKIGRKVREREPLSLAELATDSWEYAGEERGSVEIEETVVRADPERLRRILNELITNCFVHTEGEITVEIGPLPESNGFHVTDDGPGIPADEMQYVFDRGYTTDQTRDGNGLAIVEEIASAHGWSVQFGEQTGTRVEIQTTLW